MSESHDPSDMRDDQPLWRPTQDRIESANLTRFISKVNTGYGLAIDGYDAFYQWSIDCPEDFWSEVWDFCGIIGDKGQRILVDGDDIEAACWFPDARLNFAENLLRKRSDEVAIYFRAEDQIEYQLTWRELWQQTAAVAAWLREQGLRPGDRVAAYLPNIPEAVFAMLAATSLGAIWTSTSPDFGVDSVVDRFGQTEPRFLFTTDGYFYNGKQHSLTDKVSRIHAQVTSIETIVQIPFAGCGLLPDSTIWTDLIAREVDTIEFVPCHFNDPLYVLYSSGTTGKPKCITHKVGGTLIQHLKEQMLHCDLKSGDKLFYFTTLGWMMWNWLVSGLASRAALVLYDGSPFYPDGEVLWRYAEATGMTVFGTSAKYIDAMKKNKVHPVDRFKLPSLRAIASTGSVLAPESFDFVYRHIKQDVCLASVSGGTDIVSCFMLCCPLLPVYRGEIQCRGLGLAVDVFDEQGNPVTDEKGELVCTRTFPSQPVYFWADPEGKKYHDAYFARFDNVWHHGDYVRLTPRGGIIVYGRSDATLNPGGVRIGTAEIYRHVEQLDEVIESIVIGQEWEDDVRIILFVVLQDGIQLDEHLADRIRQTVRDRCTPRHVPARILQVAEIPRTKSGKIVELAVREVVHRRPVKNLGSLANPEALEHYRDLPALQS